MRLSEAIRLGAMQGPQLFGKWLDGKGGSCALGAVYIAIGQQHLITPLYTLFPSLHILVSNHCDLKAAITRLNDCHRWSREQIADWIVVNGYDCDYVPSTIRPTPKEEQIAEWVIANAYEYIPSTTRPTPKEAVCV